MALSIRWLPFQGEVSCVFGKGTGSPSDLSVVHARPVELLGVVATFDATINSHTGAFRTKVRRLVN